MKWLIIYFTFTLLFSGCGSTNKIQYPEPASTDSDGSFHSKPGVFKFGEIEYNADYGTITVKENRHNNRSRLIHLPVIRVHAFTDNQNEPLFGLAGGPGESNMIFHPIDKLLYDHDFVIVGYRGVDGSSVLDCPEVADAFENGCDDLLSEQSLREIGEAWTQCYSRLESSGVDLNGYTIPETVEDLEAVRKALGYDRINLISESYGTRIAYIYGLMHPESIHRSVMIAANPPGRFFYDPQKTDEQIKYYSRLWAKDSVRVKKCEDLAATMQEVLNNMPEKWLVISINPGKVKTVAFALLFQRNTAAMVFDSFIAAKKGDYSGLALMSIAFDYVFPDMCVWGEFATKAVSADFDSAKFYSANDYPNKILGSPMNTLFWGPLKYARLPIKMIPDSLRTLVNSDVETLILSGSIDFSTPAECGKEFLPYLTNGRQVIISEAGHVGDIRYLQLDEIKSLIRDYITEGAVDTSNLEYVPMDFKTSWGFPKMAKTALVVMGGLVCIIVAGVILIF
ncbi:MAG: alpha/beta hydrolase [Calditrichaceae bacterium]